MLEPLSVLEDIADKSNVGQYHFVMKNLAIRGFMASLVFLSVLPVANAIENGTSALNNPRVVSLYFKVTSTDGYQVAVTGCTGWLYAPRIVFTNGHCIYDSQKRPDKVLFDLNRISVGIPGERTNPQAPHAKVIKTFSYPTFQFYNASVGGSLSYQDDFAIIVLEKPLSNVKTANLLTKQMLDELLSKDTLVSTAGYGLQSKAERDSVNYSARFVEPKFAKFKMITFTQGMNVVNEFKSKWNRNYFQEDVVFMEVPKSGPSQCDGDSGSGFYLETNGVFTYLGVIHATIGSPNCLDEGWGSQGAIAAFRPVFMDLELVNQAEEYVKLNTPAEIVKVKKTISCSKGKNIKKFTSLAPKCPKSYKRTA